VAAHPWARASPRHHSLLVVTKLFLLLEEPFDALDEAAKPL